MESATGNGVAHPTIRGHIDEIGHSAQHIIEESRSLVSDVATVLDIPGRMERSPYTTLLIAAGIGFVLGGGLFTSLTGTLLRTGIRVAAMPILKTQLSALAEAAISGSSSREH